MSANYGNIQEHMRVGFVVFLLGVIVILVGVIFFGEGEDISLTSDDEISEGEEVGTGSGLDGGVSTPPSSSAPAGQTQGTGTTPPASTQQSSSESGVTIVAYTDDGFIPPVVEVEAGKIVRFVNTSSKPMWVTSYGHPTATEQYYPGFDQGKSSSPGESYTFLFSKVGVWGYKNLNNDEHLGAVSVLVQD